MVKINQRVLMSSAEYFTDEFAINPHMGQAAPADNSLAVKEHQAVRQAYLDAGIKVEQVPAPAGCQDGVYTANWGLNRGNKVVLSSLPNKRQGEQPHAKAALQKLGFETIDCPVRFSGQGDALPCGNRLFMGTTYRTDPKAHAFVAEQLGYQVVSLQTVPVRQNGMPVVNQVTGWPDSLFYDIDLALSVLSPSLIAWCPEAFVPESQTKILQLDLEKIEVSYEEAVNGYACNLVSTGETVVMSANAPKLQAAIEAKGLKTITPDVSELAKGGGFIRCVSLTLDNA
jgi:N-dimethylarginine dimethylaminohydrolase